MDLFVRSSRQAIQRTSADNAIRWSWNNILAWRFGPLRPHLLIRDIRTFLWILYGYTRCNSYSDTILNFNNMFIQRWLILFYAVFSRSRNDLQILHGYIAGKVFSIICGRIVVFDAWIAFLRGTDQILQGPKYKTITTVFSDKLSLSPYSASAIHLRWGY